MKAGFAWEPIQVEELGGDIRVVLQIKDFLESVQR